LAGVFFGQKTKILFTLLENLKLGGDGFGFFLKFSASSHWNHLIGANGAWSVKAYIWVRVFSIIYFIFFNSFRTGRVDYLYCILLYKNLSRKLDICRAHFKSRFTAHTNFKGINNLWIIHIQDT